MSEQLMVEMGNLKVIVSQLRTTTEELVKALQAGLMSGTSEAAGHPRTSMQRTSGEPEENPQRTRREPAENQQRTSREPRRTNGEP